jgi:uncharacterized protein (TIGR03437 family)
MWLTVRDKPESPRPHRQRLRRTVRRAAGHDTLSRIQSLLSVTFDQTAVDLSAPDTYSSRAPRYVGLHHINSTVPNVSDGDHQLTVIVNGVP